MRNTEQERRKSVQARQEVSFDGSLLHKQNFNGDSRVPRGKTDRISFFLLKTATHTHTHTHASYHWAFHGGVTNLREVRKRRKQHVENVVLELLHGPAVVVAGYQRLRMNIRRAYLCMERVCVVYLFVHKRAFMIL